MRIVEVRERTLPISRYADPAVPSGGLTTSAVAARPASPLIARLPCVMFTSSAHRAPYGGAPLAGESVG